MIERHALDKKHKSVPVDFYHEGIKKNIIQKVWHTKRFKEIEKIFEELPLGASDTILDLGCNTGYLSEIMRKTSGSRVVGVEISPDVVKFAKKEFPYIDFIEGDISRELPFEENSFLAASAYDVLEHVLDLDSVLKSLSKCLKDGGYLVVSFPNETFLFKIVWFVWTHMKGKVLQDVHVRDFKKEEFEKIFGSYGFTNVVHRKTHLGMWHIAVFKLKK